MDSLVRHRETCRLCGSDDIMLSMPMPQVPIVSPNMDTRRAAAGELLSSATAPLDNYLCRACGLIQMLDVVDPSLVYRNYLYRTATSLGLSEHFRELSESVLTKLPLAHDDLVVEFGSNDGTLLNFFREAGMRVIGVDPASAIAAEATARGVPTRNDFFTAAVGAEIAVEHGRARAVLANNALANIDDLKDVFRGVKALLADDGVFVFETQYALDVVEKFLLDVLYHEHITCFSVKPLVTAMSAHGLAVCDVERIPTKGGSIRVWLQHDGGPREVTPAVAQLVELEEQAGLYDPARHGAFADRAKKTRDQLHAVIDEVREAGGSVAGYGTSVGCAALIHQFELEDKLDVMFDDNPFKDVLEGPGYSLPVRRGDQLADVNPEIVVLLAWRYADPVRAKQSAYLHAGGRMAVPLPTLSFIQS